MKPHSARSRKNIHGESAAATRRHNEAVMRGNQEPSGVSEQAMGEAVKAAMTQFAKNRAAPGWLLSEGWSDEFLSAEEQEELCRDIITVALPALLESDELVDGERHGKALLRKNKESVERLKAEERLGRVRKGYSDALARVARERDEFRGAFGPVEKRLEERAVRAERELEIWKANANVASRQAVKEASRAEQAQDEYRDAEFDRKVAHERAVRAERSLKEVLTAFPVERAVRAERELERWRACAKRMTFKPGVCSKLHGPDADGHGDPDCMICFPDVSELVGEHRRVAHERAVRAERALADCKEALNAKEVRRL